MSLDVSLHIDTSPDEIETCPHCGGTGKTDLRKWVFDANITHNLNRMAEAAGIYQHLWRPEEIGITKARQLIEPLREGLKRMRANPEKFEALNPSNGWGSYGVFVLWIEKYLRACAEYPDADVSVSR